MWWIAIICAILLIIVGCGSLVISFIEWDSQIFIVAILCDVIGTGFLAILIYQFRNDKKIKKEVALWIKDAISLYATVEVIGSFRAGCQPRCIKICVNFDIEGRVYARESTVKVLGGKKGFSSAFKKYANKTIKILYSPLYDEVLILRDKIATR